MRECRSCGRVNPDDADFCECGEYLRWEPTDYLPAVPRRRRPTPGELRRGGSGAGCSTAVAATARPTEPPDPNMTIASDEWAPAPPAASLGPTERRA